MGKSWRKKSWKNLGKKLGKNKEKVGKKLEFCFKKKLKKVGIFFYFFQLFFSTHHPDQMSEGSRVSEITICVWFLKSARRRRQRRPRGGIELPGQLKIQGKTQERTQERTPITISERTPGTTLERTQEQPGGAYTGPRPRLYVLNVWNWSDLIFFADLASFTLCRQSLFLLLLKI